MLAGCKSNLSSANGGDKHARCDCDLQSHKLYLTQRVLFCPEGTRHVSDATSLCNVSKFASGDQSIMHSALRIIHATDLAIMNLGMICIPSWPCSLHLHSIWAPLIDSKRRYLPHSQHRSEDHQGPSSRYQEEVTQDWLHRCVSEAKQIHSSSSPHQKHRLWSPVSTRGSVSALRGQHSSQQASFPAAVTSTQLICLPGAHGWQQLLLPFVSQVQQATLNQPAPKRHGLTSNLREWFAETSAGFRCLLQTSQAWSVLLI